MSDLESRSFIRRGMALVPADIAADESLAGIQEGEEILITVRRARNPRAHRWFLALLRKIVEAYGKWHSVDELLDALKFETGHVELRARLDGTMYLTPRSVSFSAMGEAEFTWWREQALRVLAEAGIDTVELLKEIVQ